MTNFDRNTRTLIVSFLIAIFALIPLRFIEAGQEQESLYYSQSQVLGESTEVGNNVEEKLDEVRLEAPYDVLESCVSKSDLVIISEEVFRQFDNGEISEDEARQLLEDVAVLQKNVCP
ncbi:MAG TPA: hypothetical protein VN174_02590 [Candidatus Methanoperedens sp.]|nr:hypothetical protein [Candidatus Methanoperedens sp.]